MQTNKTKELAKDKQIERMMDDGLGAGRTIEEEDREKLKSPTEQKKSSSGERDAKSGSMVEDMKDLQKLGGEMEQMQTGRQVKKDGQKPDPDQ